MVLSFLSLSFSRVHIISPITLHAWMFSQTRSLLSNHFFLNSKIQGTSQAICIQISSSCILFMSFGLWPRASWPARRPNSSSLKRIPAFKIGSLLGLANGLRAPGPIGRQQNITNIHNPPRIYTPSSLAFNHFKFARPQSFLSYIFYCIWSFVIVSLLSPFIAWILIVWNGANPKIT